MKRIYSNMPALDPAAWRQRAKIAHLYRDHRLTSGQIAKGLDLKQVDVLRVLRGSIGGR